MERSTVIGNLRTRMEVERLGETVTGRQGEESPARPLFPPPRLFPPRPSVSPSPRLLLTAGFTLLELMIVISIIIILAAITLPQFQKTILHTREAVLRQDLTDMRKLIDQFA